MIRPRRSLLFMPGSNARALEKARNLPADGIILDLEDSVAPDAKAVARDQIAKAIAAGGFGKREVLIRVNSLDTPWWVDDVTMAGKARPDGILVPKVSTRGRSQRHCEPPERHQRRYVHSGLGHARNRARGAGRRQARRGSKGFWRPGSQASCSDPTTFRGRRGSACSRAAPR